MDAGLGAAGIICIAVALGHATVGLRWVLPRLSVDRLPDTGLGPATMTAGMIRVTWHVVTIFVLCLGGLLVTLAWDPGADPKTMLLRWFAGMWIATTVLAGWITRRRPLSPLTPVPVLWTITAVLLWWASL